MGVIHASFDEGSVITCLPWATGPTLVGLQYKWSGSVKSCFCTTRVGNDRHSGVRSNPSFDQILRTIRIDIGVTATLRCCPTELSSICLVEHVLNDPE